MDKVARKHFTLQPPVQNGGNNNTFNKLQVQRESENFVENLKIPGHW